MYKKILLNLIESLSEEKAELIYGLIMGMIGKDL